MPSTNRRDFAKTAAFAVPAASLSLGQSSPGDRINLGVVGFRGRGRDHYRNFAGIPGVRVGRGYFTTTDHRSGG